jgi:hypothetical protein
MNQHVRESKESCRGCKPKTIFSVRDIFGVSSNQQGRSAMRQSSQGKCVVHVRQVRRREGAAQLGAKKCAQHNWLR